MRTIKEMCEEIIALASQEGTKKEDFKGNIFELNSFLEEALKDTPKSRTESISLFQFDEDERLRQIEAKEEAFKKNPYIGIQEGVKYGQSKIRNFLDYYNLGTCLDFSLTRYGSFDVGITCMISAHSCFFDNKESKKIKFNLQMKILEEYGFDIKKKETSAILLATNNNMELINKLLSSFGCGLIKISIITTKKEGQHIEKINFHISAKDLFATDFKMPDIKFKESEKLNPDEVTSIIHDTKEIYSTYLAFNELGQVRGECASIIRSEFSSICKKLKIETTISLEQENKHKKTREKNIAIREREQNLGSLISGEDMRDGMEKINQKLEKICVEQIGAYCSDIVFTEYSMSFCLTPSLDFYCLNEDVEEMTKEDFYEKYECFGGEDNRDLRIIANDKNISIIESALKTNFPSCYIKGINIENSWNTPAKYIKSISIEVNNILDLL